MVFAKNLRGFVYWSDIFQPDVTKKITIFRCPAWQGVSLKVTLTEIHQTRADGSK